MIADYRHHDFDVIKLIWSRGAAIPADKNSITFSLPSRFGAGFANFAGHVRWLAFVARSIIEVRHKIDVVHCVDLDTALVAAPLGRLLGKVVVFDATDYFGSRFAPRTLLRRFFGALEKILISSAHVVIFPERIRLSQYGIRDDENVCFIANIPEDEKHQDESTDSHSLSEPLTLVYVGTLQAKWRGLEFIPKLCSEHRNTLRFIVAGFGELSEYFTQEAESLPNLSYVGSQPYGAALGLMRDADCLYGVYLLDLEAHRFASPNKMYEHLMVGRPLLTNTGTPPGDFVEAHCTGFVFDGSYADLSHVVASLSREECARRGAIARRLWVNEFSSLRQQQVQRYFSRLNSLFPVPAESERRSERSRRHPRTD